MLSLPTFKDQVHEVTPPASAGGQAESSSSCDISGSQSSITYTPGTFASAVAIPLAEDVTPIYEVESQISKEDKLRLEKEKLELQLELRQRDLELERQRVANLQLTLHHATARTTTGTRTPNGCSLLNSKKRWIGIGIVVTVVLVAALLVAAICGLGDCRAGSTTTSPTTTTNPSPRDPQPVLVPSPGPMIMSPTHQPVISPATSRANSIISFINNITLTGRTIDYPSTEFPEERALQWLIDVDHATLLPTNELSLRQRYALSTLWFQTPTSPFVGNTDFATTWTRTNITECEWQQVQCDDMSRVIRLRLGSENVGGRIPNDIGLLTALTRLDLSDNQLIGTIPTSLVALTVLRGLELRGNQLTGTIPSTLGYLTALTELTLSYNDLTGNIPSSLGSLTALDILGLRGNQLTGNIPTSFQALTALTELWLYNNQLTGTVPFCGLDQSFVIFITDCAEVNCTCCTHCCPVSQGNIPGYFPC